MGEGSLYWDVTNTSQKESRESGLMNDLDEVTGPKNDKGTAGSGLGQGRTIAQSGSAPKRGIGKEEQLAKISAAVNTASTSEANTTATQSMISTFSKNFRDVALDIVGKMEDDQEDLIKKMVEEITKLQTKNMSEFEKAIGKIVGLADKMVESNNPKLQALGSSMQDQAKEELFKAKGITLTGEKDTFLNRMGREVGFNTDKEPVKNNVRGIAKVAKGFISSSASGFASGLKESFRPEGGMLDRVLTTDEDKRQRELAKLQENANESGTESLADMFKKVIEEILDQGKKPGKQEFKPIDKLSDLTDDQIKSLEKQGIAPASDQDFSYRKDGKPVSKDEINKALEPSSSEKQEDSAGISADNTLAGMAAVGAALTVLQDNSTDSLDISKKLLEKMEFLASWFETNGASLGGGGGGGGGILDTAAQVAGGAAMGGLGMGALATGAAVTAGVAGVAYGAYKGYTGYQDAKQQEGAANKEIDEKVSRGELTQAQGLDQKDKTKKTARIEKSKAVGEGAGIAAGAAGGALLGATYGSALGPLGTAVGGVGGALVGGFLGGGGGKWLGEKAGQATNWWKGDSDKASAIDEKVKKGEISKAEGDKLKKQLKPSGKDKIKGAAKGAAMGSLLGPVGMVAGAAYGFFNQDEAKAETPAKPKAKTAVSDKPKAKTAVSEVSDKPRAKAAVEKSSEKVKPKAAETVKEATEPTKKKQEVAPSLDAVDESIKGKVAEIDPNGRWAKLKDGKIVDPDFPKDANSNNSAAAAYKLSSKAGKVEGKGNQTGDQISTKKTTGKTETGKNVDGALVEAGTAATKDKMQVNVPPPTVINQGGGDGEKSGPSMTPQGGVGSVRSDDPTWLQYQRKRVAF